MKKLESKLGKKVKKLQNQVDKLKRYRFEVKFKEAVSHYVDYCMTNCMEIRACDYDSSIYSEDDNEMLQGDPKEEFILIYNFDSGRFVDIGLSTINAPF
jgi:DNA-binding protein YbaB